MISVKIFRKDGLIFAFEISGHSGYSESGSDIVCSAVSTLSLTSVLSLQKILSLNPLVVKNDNKGFLSVSLEKLKISEIEKAQDILNTMVLGLNEVQKDFKKYLRIGEGK